MKEGTSSIEELYSDPEGCLQSPSNIFHKPLYPDLKGYSTFSGQEPSEQGIFDHPGVRSCNVIEDLSIEPSSDAGAQGTQRKPDILSIANISEEAVNESDLQDLALANGSTNVPFEDQTWYTEPEPKFDDSGFHRSLMSPSVQQRHLQFSTEIDGVRHLDCNAQNELLSLHAQRVVRNRTQVINDGDGHSDDLAAPVSFEVQAEPTKVGDTSTLAMGPRRRVRSRRAQAPNESSEIACKQCGRVFKGSDRRNSLRKHQRTMHEQNHYFRCRLHNEDGELCLANIEYAQNRERHLHKQHRTE